MYQMTVLFDHLGISTPFNRVYVDTGRKYYIKFMLLLSYCTHDNDKRITFVLLILYVKLLKRFQVINYLRH